MKTKRKILAVTGARSEYDLMFSIYTKLNEHPEVDFSIVITGAHLSEKFGSTYKFIEADGFKIADKIYNLIDSDKKSDRVISIGNQISLLTQTISRENPDIVLVAGDREEAISVTLTCAYLGVIVAHFFGGDIAKDGCIDNSTRYAASKFAHIHFPTMEEHKSTLLKLGEDEYRIFVVGNPAIDRLLSVPPLSREMLFTPFGLNANSIKNYCVLIQHSNISEVEMQSEHIKITLESILASGIFCFVNFPNSDPGCNAIIDCINEYCINFPQNFALFKNLNRDIYVNLLRGADFLIGNSSSGLLEAPSLGLAAINIGRRQRGRIHGENVIFVQNDKNEILDAIDKVKNDQNFIQILQKKQNPYGDGNTSSKVVEILTSIRIDDELRYKNITY